MNIIKTNIFFLVLIISGCFSSPVLAEKQQQLIPAGSLMSKSIHFQFAVYYLPAAKKDPVKVLKQLLRLKGLNFKLVDKIPKSPKKMFMQVRLEKNVLKNYSAPGLDTLKYSGRGLSKKQARVLQKSKQALIVNFAYPSKDVWNGLHAATELMEILARKTNGLLWDEVTREMFSLDAWKDRRLANWTSGVPDISKHITIHAYKSGEFIRAITLGMEKFGLPDVVVDNFVWSSNSSVGNVMNLFSQAMAEGAVVTKAGVFDLNIKSIKHPGVREPQLKSLLENAKAVAHLSLRQGIWEEGDPGNRLIQLKFDRYKGRDVHAKLDAMVSSLFGSEDSIKYIKHNAALEIESEKAKSKLPALRKDFNAGLQPGELIQVKAPFPIPGGGSEWMWVEVSKWKGNAIEDLLKNEPFNIPTLHAGQIVKVNQQDVFDYIRRYPNGKEIGNKTAEIISKMRSQ
ncbi:MAG: DUF2314 domain-containing protein [Gammaproteobacteria bacterium]|nr:DUF2314 domain-containing protein [Gammaproteobacteria bacterium]